MIVTKPVLSVRSKGCWSWNRNFLLVQCSTFSSLMLWASLLSGLIVTILRISSGIRFHWVDIVIMSQILRVAKFFSLTIIVAYAVFVLLNSTTICSFSHGHELFEEISIASSRIVSPWDLLMVRAFLCAKQYCFRFPWKPKQAITVRSVAVPIQTSFKFWCRSSCFVGRCPSRSRNEIY